jgi:cold shock CspA family protein
MFVVRDITRDQEVEGAERAPVTLVDEDRHRSTVMSLMNGYGFIRYPDNNLFFRYDDLQDVTFDQLRVNDEVEFNVAVNQKGQRVARDVRQVVADH